MAMTRNVWLTDRFGAQDDAPATVERFSTLLDSIESADGDDEHRAISITDEDEWNLEFYPRTVLFENVGEGGGEVGTLADLSRSELLMIADQFIQGDLDGLRTRFA